MEKNLNQSVYIPSLEASDLYSHNVRGTDLKLNYLGMIPYSLELIKMLELIDEPYNVGTDDKPKYLSKDVINVKFNKVLNTAKQIIKDTQKKLDKIEDKKSEENKEYVSKLSKYIKVVEKGLKSNPKDWGKLTIPELRKKLYEDGISIVDKDGVLTDYVVYKRSSAKSRNGECLFIKREYYDEMISWSRMGMKLDEGISIDYPSLLAYESLVGSSIEDTITLDPKNIFIIEDVESSFPLVANVVKANKVKKKLHSVEETTTINNAIWDGQSLLDTQYFTNNKGMMLLRNHFFKSCAFNTNIQLFFKDNGIKPDDTLIDMFENDVKASDIHMIATPSSLKALKFSEFVDGGSKRDMWDYWCKVVNNDGNKFGVVKSEKPSKHKYNKKLKHDEKGQLYREMSYQTLNSLPCSREDVEAMAKFEIDYIMRLKNDVDYFVNHHLEKSKTNQNANQMFIDLYNHNKEIHSTKAFKEFRKRTIHDHVKYVKKGKIRLPGDYCTMVGNPVLMLKKVINELDESNLAGELKENEVYTTMFEFGEELTGFRSPHTSQSNVLVVKNVHNKDIERYFNFTKNIVAVTSVKTPLLDKLSGSDFDSDTLLLLIHPRLLERAKECQDYKVVVNKLDAKPAEYTLTKQSMFEIDNILSSSTDTIGKVTNTAQLLLSLYHDTNYQKFMKHINVLTCLSGVSIDQAKKLYAIDIKTEITNIESQFTLKKNKEGVYKKPLFFVNVSQSKSTKNKVMPYKCPMDYLCMILDKLEDGMTIHTTDINDLLERVDYSKADRKQIKKIRQHVRDMQGKIVEVYSKYPGDSELIRDERNRRLDNIKDKAVQKVEKYKIKPATMGSLLKYTEIKKKENEEEKKDKNNITVRLMNALYQTHPETFLAAFKKATH